MGADVNVGIPSPITTARPKHQTVIEDESFIGSNATLVAPVTVGRAAYVAAGSSITDAVPGGALAIARGQEKKRWVEQRKRKRKQAKRSSRMCGIIGYIGPKPVMQS